MNKAAKTVAVTALAVALLCVGFYAYTLNKENKNYKSGMENSAESSYLQMKNTAEYISEQLGKCSVSSDSSYLMRTLSEVSKSSAEAGGRLASLNISHNISSEAVAFYTESADYTSALSLTLASGGELTDENRSVLSAMGQSAKALSEGFNEFYESRDTKSFSWYEKGIEYFTDDAENDRYAHVFKNFSSLSENYPELNYDGKYTAKGEFEAKGLSGEDMEYGDVQSNIQSKLGDYEGATLDYKGENNADIAGYNFSVAQGENTFDLTYSRRGGSLISASSSVVPSETKITLEEARASAEEFLAGLGITDTEAVNHYIYSNTAVFDFAYTKDGIRYYPDSLSVQVSMEDASILSYNAASYYTYHSERDLPEPLLTQEAAEEKISDGLSLNGIRKAVVSSDGGNEILCYEMTVSSGGETYVILLDANSGKELNIYRRTEDENGVSVY